MSLVFSGTGTTDGVEHTDISTARFEYTLDWTALIFGRAVSPLQSDGDQALLNKWAGPAAVRQFRWKLLSSTGVCSVYHNNGLQITASSACVAATWYLFAVTNDGSSSTNNLALYIIELDGTVLINGETGTSQANRDFGSDLHVGHAGTADFFDGELAHCAYIRKLLTIAEINEYRKSPHSVVARNDTVFYLPLGRVVDPAPDWSSGAPNNFTNTGTLEVGEGPGVRPLIFGGWSNLAVGAAGAPPAGQPTMRRWGGCPGLPHGTGRSSW